MLTVLGNYSESELTRHFMTQMSHDETRADGSLNKVMGEDVTWFVSGLCDVRNIKCIVKFHVKFHVKFQGGGEPTDRP